MTVNCSTTILYGLLKISLLVPYSMVHIFALKCSKKVLLSVLNHKIQPQARNDVPMPEAFFLKLRVLLCFSWGIWRVAQRRTPQMISWL